MEDVKFKLALMEMKFGPPFFLWRVGDSSHTYHTPFFSKLPPLLSREAALAEQTTTMVTPTKAMSYTALLSGGHSHHPVTATQTVYTVSYNSESHLSVLTQMWGSKWPQVLPFCLVNVAIMIFVTYLNDRFSSHKIGMTARGHTFLGVVVSFLLISRVNEAYDRYQKQRGFLSTMYREARQLVQYAFIYSANSTDLQSKEWRAELAYRTLILLRTTMAVIDYPTTKVPAWAIPELFRK